jgi:hypothetical protein
MFPNGDVAWTWILPEQGRVQVSRRLSGGEPVTTIQDYEFLPHCGPETYAAVHLSHFNDHIPKDVVHETGDLGHTLDLFCGFV